MATLKPEIVWKLRRRPPPALAAPLPPQASLRPGRLVARVLAPFVLVLAALPWFVFGGQPDAPSKAGSGSQPKPTSYDHLEHALRRVRSAWVDADRAEEVAAVRQRLDVLRTPMLWVLQRPEQPAFADVAWLAGEVGLSDFVRPLREAARSAAPLKLRLAAWRASDRIEPLPDAELAELMAEASPGMQVLGLELAASRTELSPGLLEAVLTRLGSGDADVRAAARAALPERIPSRNTHLLLPLLAAAETRASAVDAMTRVDPPADAAAILAQQLANGRPEVACPILAAIDPLAGEPAVQSQLWLQVRDAADDRVRIAALACIERNRLDASPLPHDLFTSAWSPPAQVMAARLRLRDGDHGAIDRLLQLAQSAGSAEADYARHAARVTLAAVTGRSPDDSIDNLRAACGQTRPAVDKLALPAVPPF